MINWLLRKFKDLPTPKVRFEEGILPSGYYCRPYPIIPSQWRKAREQAGEQHFIQLAERSVTWFASGETLSHEQGLIVVKAELPDWDIAATLAHEFRHHWQAYNQKPWSATSFDTKCDHATAVKRYYQSSPQEADALRYELAVTPNDHNRWNADVLGWPTRRVSYLA